MKYRIYFTNFHYAPEPEFLKLEDAIAFACRKSFECAIQRIRVGREWESIGCWSVISGYREFMEA